MIKYNKIIIKRVIFLQKLEKNATNSEIISKINEILEFLEKNNTGGVIEFDVNTINKDVKAYLDGTGGML